jgi:hypothetical protein
MKLRYLIHESKGLVVVLFNPKAEVKCWLTLSKNLKEIQRLNWTNLYACVTYLAEIEIVGLITHQ